MAEERIELSAKERERLKVLHEIQQGHLRQIDAAHRLRLSARQVRRLLQRLHTVGDRGLVHGLRGRRSNRRISEAIERDSLRRLRQPAYAGFGPTLASEHFQAAGPSSEPGDAAEVDECRRIVADPSATRASGACVAAAACAAFGELVMMDSSPYRWLENRGPACHLIALIDDATSRAWGRFVEHDSTEENLQTLRGWLERHGRPLALYTDKNSLFVTTRPQQWAEQLQETPARTQFGRARPS